MIIYKAQNKISGKCYIGQTIKTLDTRKEQHIKFSKTNNSIFYNALRSYGEDNFTWEIIEHVNSKQELNEREKYYINEYDSIRNGYNMVAGGTGGYNEYAVIANRKKRGKKWEDIYSPEGLTVMKKAVQNAKWPEFTKEERIKHAKIGNKARTMKGYKHSDDTKQKMSEAQIGISNEERHGEKRAKEISKLISERTKEAMAKLDNDEIQRKSLIGRKKYWNTKHEEDRARILDLKRKGTPVKTIVATLDITPPTYYARLRELKSNGLL